jgi:hypothetical protein
LTPLSSPVISLAPVSETPQKGRTNFYTQSLFKIPDPHPDIRGVVAMFIGFFQIIRHLGPFSGRIKV